MGNPLFEVFNEYQVDSVHENVQSLMKCQHEYMKLIKEYKEEIEFINQKIRDLRKEEVEFYEKKLHEVEQIMRDDEVDEQIRKAWMNDLENSMKISFEMSHRLLNDFYILGLDEFNSKADALIQGG